MRQSGRVNHQGHLRKDGSPAQARSTTTSGHEATRDDPMPGSSYDHRRQPTAETDVVDQSVVMDSGTARVSDEGKEDISAEEQARRRLRSKQPARRSLTDDGTVSKRLKRKATKILKTVAGRPDLETSTQISLKHQNIEESRVDSCIKNGRDQQVARKRSCGKVES